MWLTKRRGLRFVPLNPELQAPGTSPAALTRETFLRLPRLEYLRGRRHSVASALEALITNETEQLPRRSLPVEDDALAELGIYRGDLVITESRRGYCNGDIVAAVVGERTIIRRYAGSHGRIRLEDACNPQQILIADAATPGFSILGCVVQIIRRLNLDQE